MTTLPSLSTHRSALFLDFDGTLADLASRPDAVVVPPDLTALLDALHQRLGGAFALVTGRPRADLKALLSVLHWPAAFEHGAIRYTGDGVEHITPQPDLADVVARAKALTDRHPDLLLEIKQRSIALHYRLSPGLATTCVDTLAQAIEGRDELQLLHGKAVVEVKSSQVGKDHAIEAFMAEAPFAGRLPVFAGDDVTDEAGFALVERMGGVAIKVGDGPTRANHRCPTPQALRAWLRAHLSSTT